MKQAILRAMYDNQRSWSWAIPIIIALIPLFSGREWQSWQSLAALIPVISIFSFHVGKRQGAFPGIAVFYFFCHSAFFLFKTPLFYQPFGNATAGFFNSKISAATFLFLAAVYISGFNWTKRKIGEFLYSTVPLVSVFSMVSIFTSDFFHKPLYLFNAKSVDAAFVGIAAMEFFARTISNDGQKKKAWSVIYLAVAVLVLFYADSVTAWLAFLITGVTFLAVYFRIGAPLILASSVIGVGLAYYGSMNWGSFFSDSGRYSVWALTWSKIVSNSPNLFGFGLGTFELWGPDMVIKATGKQGSYWSWAHNEWLQILFETGWVGLGLTCLSIIRSVFLNLRNPSRVSLIIGFCILASTQSILRIYPLALLCALLMSTPKKSYIE